jgi:8-oxo-dGTP pyrophosphatase MutT (NUDIX family)
MSDDQTIVQRIATKALIVNDKGQILILREASTYEEGTNVGKYHLPGGRLNPGEAFLDGLKREVDEESGLQIEIGKPIYVGEWRPVIKGVQNQIVAIFFICKPLSSKVRLSEEHDDYKWVLPNEIKTYDVMSPEDKVIETYIESLAS